MAKCSGCRVRHLSCDENSPCTECEKGARECVRLNVRFRNLVCPSNDASTTEQRKFEFFFDKNQVWVEAKGNLDFVKETDLAGETSPTSVHDDVVFGLDGSNMEPGVPLPEQHASTLMHDPASETLASADPLPDCSTVMKQVQHNPGDQRSIPIEDVSAQPSEGIRAAENEPTRVIANLSQQGVLSSQLLSFPLANLEEGRLLQHFITHLAPWVRMAFMSMKVS